MTRVLAVAFLLAAAPALAQSEADEAAAAVLPYLDEPAVLAATAALIHESTGQYPADPFALLGAPEAGATGARRLLLAELGLAATADTLRVLYILTPTPAEPAERIGGFALFREGDGYTARFRLERRADPDLRDAALPIATTRTLRVRSARGRLCLDPVRVRDFAAAGVLPQRAPFLSDDAIEVAFIPTRGGEAVARAMLSAPRP